MYNKINERTVITLILAFWSCWYTLACLSNITDLIYVIGFIKTPFTFHSGNYALIVNVLSIYQWPTWAAIIIFVLDILLQLIIASLFIFTFISMLQKKHCWTILLWPLSLNIALWGLFIITEEFFLAYSLEGVHQHLMIMAMLSLLLINNMMRQITSTDKATNGLA